MSWIETNNNVDTNEIVNPNKEWLLDIDQKKFDEITHYLDAKWKDTYEFRVSLSSKVEEFNDKLSWLKWKERENFLAEADKAIDEAIKNFETSSDDFVVKLENKFWNTEHWKQMVSFIWKKEWEKRDWFRSLWGVFESIAERDDRNKEALEEFLDGPSKVKF